MNRYVKLVVAVILCVLFCSCGEKQTTVHFRAEGFETGLMKGTCKEFKCSHYEGSAYYTDGSMISTKEIVIPKGQVWSYKDYSTDYYIEDTYGTWITRPYILYNIDGSRRWKKCRIPDDARSVRFYPGDRIRIGTYASATSGYYEYIDIQVAFNIEYL